MEKLPPLPERALQHLKGHLLVCAFERMNGTQRRLMLNCDKIREALWRQASIDMLSFSALNTLQAVELDREE